MKRPQARIRANDSTAAIPQHDYRPALQSAVSWLGDRYLLAEPVPRLQVEPAPYFSEPRRWHPVMVAKALARTSRQDAPSSPCSK